jgi:predicted RNA-binding protein with EMAP domain
MEENLNEHTCTKVEAIRMDKLIHQVGGLDQRVQNVEAQLQAEILRATEIDNDFKDTIKQLMSDIKNKNEFADFVHNNWKYILGLIVIMTGGDITNLIQALNVFTKASG